jgi:rhamnosyltransferase
MGGEVISASIVIRTKNEAKYLASTLEGVLGQTLRPHEIFIVDSGSADETIEIARRYPVRILTIKPELWNYSRAINIAAAAASGEALVCLSAHCRPMDEHWLAALTRHLTDPIVAGVWGPGYRPGREIPVPGLAERQLTYGRENRSWGLSNSNSAIRHSLWQELPFDETLPATEDKAWGMSMLARGFVIVHDPAAAVWHAAHDPVNAFRRNRAVQSGYHLIFPDLRSTAGVQAAIVGRRAVQLTRQRLESRDFSGFGRDLRRLAAVLASLAGGLVARAGRVLSRPHRDPRNQSGGDQRP